MHLEVRSIMKALSDFLLFWVFGILFFPDLIFGSFGLIWSIATLAGYLPGSTIHSKSE